MNNIPASPEVNYEEWEATRRDLWEGRSIRKVGGIEIPEILGIRQLITTQWGVLGLDSSQSHWSILELSGLEQKLSAEFIKRMGVLGITRENQVLFDEYCRFLEGRPENAASQNSPVNPGNKPPILEGPRRVVELVFEILFALVIPHTRK